MADIVGRPVTLEGIADVEAALRGEDFPMDREAIDYAVGEIEVRDHTGRGVPVRVALDAVREQRSDTVESAIAAICAGVERAAAQPREEA